MPGPSCELERWYSIKKPLKILLDKNANDGPYLWIHFWDDIAFKHSNEKPKYQCSNSFICFKNLLYWQKQD